MGVIINRFINSRFTSNTFILSTKEASDVWIIDPGDVLPIFEWMNINRKSSISGVLLTHSHFDHIYGLNELLDVFPLCPIYVANEYGRTALYDAKKNGSHYTENSFVLREKANVIICESKLILWDCIPIEVIHTVGHSPDSVCFVIENQIFTGDTLIKDVRTVTKLKGGSVEYLKLSIDKIRAFQGGGFIVHAGHEGSFPLDDYNLDVATLNPINK